MLADFKYWKEQQVMEALENNMQFEALLDAFHTVYTNLTSFAQLKGRNYLITESTNLRISRIYRAAAKRLEVSEEIPVYANMDYKLGAEIVGTDGDCAIVISSACLEKFDDRQILALFGHELAHIRYRHVKYLNIYKVIDALLPRVPIIGSAASEVIKSLLVSWNECAEYTADRGAAVAAGGIVPVMENLSLGMGACFEAPGIDFYYDTVLMSEAVQEEEMTKIGQMVFQTVLRSMPVPFGMLRMKKLKAWHGEEACRRDFSFVYYGSLSEFGLEKNMDKEALYNQAKVMINSNRGRGMALLHAAAEKKEPHALAFLSKCYLSGNYGLTKNEITGLEYMQEAALLGDAGAQYGLAVCLENGLYDVCQKNHDRAVWLFRLAASRGQKGAGQWLQEHSVKVPLIKESTLSEVFEWFLKNFPMGPCVVNISNTLEGLNPDIAKDFDKLRDYLWIPLREPVYALETAAKKGRILEAAAVCRTGIYVNYGMGLPYYISWTKLRRKKMDGVRRAACTELRMDGRRLWDYRECERERSIARLIIRLKRVVG